MGQLFMETTGQVFMFGAILMQQEMAVVQPIIQYLRQLQAVTFPLKAKAIQLLLPKPIGVFNLTMEV